MRQVQEPVLEPKEGALRGHIKFCSKCGLVKKISGFSKDCTQKDGLSRRCKSCRKKEQELYYANNRERVKMAVRRYKKSHFDLYSRCARRYHLKKKFGITESQFESLLAGQNGKCKICGRSDSGRLGSFSVDHDHITGEIRGLLCYRCNVGLGHFGDSPVILRKAAAYLSKHRSGAIA